jgi:hypothetical protein
MTRSASPTSSAGGRSGEKSCLSAGGNIGGGSARTGPSREGQIVAYFRLNSALFRRKRDCAIMAAHLFPVACVYFWSC